MLPILKRQSIWQRDGNQMKSKILKSSVLIDSYTAALENYLENTENLIVVIIDDNYEIQEYNQPFFKLINSRASFRRVKVEDIKGQSIHNFLMPESLSAVQEQREFFIKKKLNFSVAGSPSMTVTCYIFKLDNSALIIGEHITLTDSHFMDKMSILNNEMTNMVRQIQQKNREIQQKNHEIESKNSQLEQKSREIEQKNRDLEQKNSDLERAHSEIKTLSGIIPICMHCKEVRDDKGYWNKVEEYISMHSTALFSHGICPTCMKKYYSAYL